MASSIAAARLALHALLAAHTWPGTQPQVEFGAPAAYEEQEVVALLGVQDPDEEFAALGAQRKAESYDLEVGVKAHDPGAVNAQAVDTRAFALAEAVRVVVNANPNFAGAPPITVIPAQVISQTSDGAQAADGGGWVAFCVLRIRCQTRIL
jgi:hypothetical protein